MKKTKAKKQIKKKKVLSPKNKAMLKAGVAAVGTGAYYFLGPDGKKHQKKALAMMTKAKNEVVNDIKKAKPVIKRVGKDINKNIKLAKKMIQ